MYIYIHPVIVYFESGIIFWGFTKWKSYDSSVHPSCNWSLQDPCHGNLRASSSERDHECHCISPRNVTQKIILYNPNILIFKCEWSSPFRSDRPYFWCLYTDVLSWKPDFLLVSLWLFDSLLWKNGWNWSILFYGLWLYLFCENGGFPRQSVK